MVDIANDISIAHFLPYQIDHILDGSTALIEEKSRRIGITYANSYKHVRRRARSETRRDLWFSSADDSAAYEYAQYSKQWAQILKQAVKEVLLTDKDDDGYRFNNYALDFPQGSRINCMSSNPKRFRSKGGDVVLDEFAWHNEAGKMWDAASPCITWGYTIELLSTHNGKNSEFNLFIQKINRVLSGQTTFDALKIPEFKLRRTTIVDAVNQGLAEKVYRLKQVDPAAREKFIKFCRSLCRNEDQWNQEYMCVPSEEETTLISYDLYNKCTDADCLTHKADGMVYIGYDIGRKHDRSIFWVAELVGDVLVTREVVNLNKTDYPTQLGVGESLFAKYKVARLCGDYTGKGDAVIEFLQRKFGAYAVEPVTFTNPRKDHMAGLVLSRMEDRRCRLPDDIKIRESFHSIRKTMTADNRPRYDAARTDEGHADEFWAFALCCEAANVPAAKPEIICLSKGDDEDFE
jgi:phage FluMu gp28-like protein